MPPFEYQPYRNPAIGSISDIILRRGEIGARAAQQVGNAQAWAAQGRGAAAAGMANAIAGGVQQIAQIPQQIQEQKRQALQTEADTMAVEDMKRKRADLTALDAAFAKGGSRDLILNNIPGHLRGDVMKQFQEADKLGAESKKAMDEARKAQAEHFGFLGAQIKQNNYDTGTALAAIHQARETYADDPELVKQIDAMRMAVIEQPERVKQIADAAILGSSYKDMLKPVTPMQRNPAYDLVDPVTQQVISKGTPAAKPVQSEDFLLDGKRVKGTFDPSSGKYLYNGQDVTGRVQPIPPASMGGDEKPIPGDWSKSGDEFLKTIPAEWRNTVQKLANYDADITRVTSMRPGVGGEPERSIVARWVMQLNPQWDEGVAPGRISARKDFMSGAKSKNIVSLNTAISHAGKLADLATALNNGDTQAVNGIVNYVRTQLGYPEVTNAQTAATALAGESATTFKSSGGTDQEIEKWDRVVAPVKKSPKQIAGSLETLASLLAGRFYSLAGEYENVMGKKDMNFLTRDARAQLKKLGVDANSWEPEGAATVYNRGGTTSPAKTGGDEYWSRDKDGNPIKVKGPQ